MKGTALTVCVNVRTAPVATKGSKEMFERDHFQFHASHTTSINFIFLWYG